MPHAWRVWQVLKLMLSILGLDDAQRVKVERGVRRLHSPSGWGVGMLFRPASYGWEAITEAEISEQWVQVSPPLPPSLCLPPSPSASLPLPLPLFLSLSLRIFP